MKSLISQNFAGLQMYIDQSTMMEFDDSPQLPLIGFISQLGGALNLWAGITVVVVIEFVELGYELIVEYSRRPPEAKHSDSEASEVGEKDVITQNNTDLDNNMNSEEKEWVW